MANGEGQQQQTPTIDFSKYDGSPHPPPQIDFEKYFPQKIADKTTIGPPPKSPLKAMLAGEPVSITPQKSGLEELRDMFAGSDHPAAQAIADKLTDLQELLFGGQSVGKLLGTKSGLVNNPVTSAMLAAEGGAKGGAAVENAMRKTASRIDPELAQSVAKGVAKTVLDEIPGFKTASKVAKLASKVANAGGPIELPLSAFDTSKAEAAVTPFEGVGKPQPPAAPTIRRGPGEIAPEQVSSTPAAPIPKPTVKTTGDTLLPGGGVIKRPPAGLLPEKAIDFSKYETPPQTTSTVNVSPDSFIKKVSDPESHVSSKVVNSYRAQIRAGQQIDPLKLELDADGNVIGADGRHRALAAKLEGVKEIPVQVVKREPLPPEAEPMTINDIVDQATGNTPLEKTVPLKAQPTLKRGTPGSRVAMETEPRTVAPEKVTTTFEEEVGKTTGAPPLNPKVPLRKQALQQPGTETEETPQARLERLYPDSGTRQMVHANGEEIVNAIGEDKTTMKAVHDLTNTDVRQALLNAGEDMTGADGNPLTVGSRKAVGNQISRQEAFKRLLAKGHAPAEIVKLAKNSTLSKMANP